MNLFELENYTLKDQQKLVYNNSITLDNHSLVNSLVYILCICGQIWVHIELSFTLFISVFIFYNENYLLLL